MAFSSSLCFPLMSLKPIGIRHNFQKDQTLTSTLRCVKTDFSGQQVAGIGETHFERNWSFVGGSRVLITPKLASFVYHRNSSGVNASCCASSQIAGSVFTVATAAVLPFYTLMVFAPKAEITRKSVESSIPYIVLGLLYAYLLCLSWTPETLQLMFASKYWLPELPGIAKMFANEMTLASAWVHLLVVDLFAARQVFNDGIENEVETRHSVSLCLLFCPVGIFTHFITKALTKSR